MNDENTRWYTVEITDPVLKKHIERGWVKGMSVGSDGSKSFISTYPRWYRICMFVKQCVRRLWRRVLGYKPVRGFEINKETGTVTLGETIPKGATILMEYTYKNEQMN